MDQPGGFGTRGILGAYGSAPGRPPGSAGHADGPNFGHRFDNPLRDSGYRYPPTDFHYRSRAKPDRTTYPGKLQPLPVPEATWDTISLDFIEGLPRSSTADCILVVVDKFTKYGHFIPLSHPYTALTVAQCFMTEVYRLHGLPSAIISDRDPIFTSQFWRHLFRLTGTDLTNGGS